MSGTHIDLDEIFRAVVAEYDRISPILVANNFGMTMVRARQNPEERKPLPNRDALMALDGHDISGHEGHCLSDGYIYAKAFNETYIDNDILASKLSDMAKEFNKRSGLADSKAPFGQVNELLHWVAYLKLAELRGVTLTVKPDLDPLERHLGLAQ